MVRVHVHLILTATVWIMDLLNIVFDLYWADDIGDVGFTRHESWDILSIDQSSSTPNDTPKTQIVSNDSTYSGSKKTNDELLSGSNASSPDLREARLSAIKRASELSKRLLSRDIPTHITDNGGMSFFAVLFVFFVKNNTM